MHSLHGSDFFTFLWFHVFRKEKTKAAGELNGWMNGEKSGFPWDARMNVGQSYCLSFSPAGFWGWCVLEDFFFAHPFHQRYLVNSSLTLENVHTHRTRKRKKKRVRVSLIFFISFDANADAAAEAAPVEAGTLLWPQIACNMYKLVFSVWRWRSTMNMDGMAYVQWKHSTFILSLSLLFVFLSSCILRSPAPAPFSCSTNVWCVCVCLHKPKHVAMK